MIAWQLSGPIWGLIIGVAAFHVAVCVQMAYQMTRYGRSFWRWLAITIFTTTIPAMVVMYVDRARALARQVTEQVTEDEDRPDADADRTIRCGQCGRRIPAGAIDRTGPVPTCPHCHLPIPEDREKLA